MVFAKLFTTVEDIFRQNASRIPKKAVEDGYGLNAHNTSNLIAFENSPHHNDMKNRGSFFASAPPSQFYPDESNLRLRRSTTAMAATHAAGIVLAAGSPMHQQQDTTTIAVVRPHPEYAAVRRCNTSSNIISSSSSQRHSTTVPSSTTTAFESGDHDGIMRGNSIDNHNFSEVTPRTSRSGGFAAVNRQLSKSQNDFRRHMQRQDLHSIHEIVHQKSSANTGAQYSHPRKPTATSVVELPAVSVQPQPYSPGATNTQYFIDSNETFSPVGSDLNHSFKPANTSTPKPQQQYVDQWNQQQQQQRVSQHTTTFGVGNENNYRKSTTHLADNVAAAFGGEEINPRRQSSVGLHHSITPFDDRSSTAEREPLHSPMSNNSRHSSGGATTTTSTETIMPYFGSNNNGTSSSNKVSLPVAPQPQKRSSQNHHRHSKEEAAPLRFRSHVSHHSPYQIEQTNPLPYPTGLPTSRSGHRINRLSSEVFIDGPAPSTPSDARVSMLEDKVRNLEMSCRNSTSSRQNLIFNSPTSETQRVIMEELVSKEVLIGQYKARVEDLGGQLEKQKIGYENQLRVLRDEAAEEHKKYLDLLKKFEKLSSQRPSTSSQAYPQALPLQKPQATSNGFETLTEVDTDEEERVKTPTPSSSQKSSTPNLLSTSNLFSNRLRSQYRKTQICQELGRSLAEATSKMLEGKMKEAEKCLGALTDSEGDDSDAINSEVSFANSKMTMANAEHYSRKQCEMLSKLEKSLNEIRANHIEVCQKGPKLMAAAKNDNCRVQ